MILLSPKKIKKPYVDFIGFNLMLWLKIAIKQYFYISIKDHVMIVKSKYYFAIVAFNYIIQPVI